VTAGAPAAGALSGVRVVELASFIAGPMVGMLLADYGADVIKVEQPGDGDGIRTWGGCKDGIGLYHKMLNRNKRTVTADLRTPLGVDIAKRLARDADVVIENFRPGTLERWGLGYDVLESVNPGLVMLRVTGFGQDGPYRDRPGFGSLAEGMTGFAYSNGYAERPPLLPGFALADSSTGLAGAFLTLAALRARDVNGGHGQVVDLPIYEPLLTMLGPHVIEHDQLGLVPERAGGRLPLVAPRGTFQTRDGRWIAISAGASAVFRGLCRALGVEALADDPRFSEPLKLFENAAIASGYIVDAFSKKPFEYWREHLKTMKGQWAPIQTMRKLITDEQAVTNDMVIEVEGADGGKPLKLVRGPVQWNGEPLETTRAPQASEHTEMVLMESGIEWDKIEEWKAKGAIA